MHQQEAQCHAVRADKPTAPAASAACATDDGAEILAPRAHLSGDGPVALSGTARAAPGVLRPHTHRISSDLGLALGLQLSSLVLVLVLLALVLPGCGPPT